MVGTESKLGVFVFGFFTRVLHFLLIAVSFLGVSPLLLCSILLIASTDDRNEPRILKNSKHVSSTSDPIDISCASALVGTRLWRSICLFNVFGRNIREHHRGPAN
jgi:hypothetical protein